ncbi:hypothetical protein ACQPZA_23975 [Pseudonocardia xinjiangensis]|uniref:hypothetical protein n=1 Tax=Pseudonocardia xinjiangensis TaxID=75289 RepID=UPI003D8C3019
MKREKSGIELQRQASAGYDPRLDLRLLIHRKNSYPTGRIEAQGNHAGDLYGELGIPANLERALPMRAQSLLAPQDATQLCECDAPSVRYVSRPACHHEPQPDRLESAALMLTES